MVLDLSGTALPPNPSKQAGSELTPIGDDFKKVGQYLSFAIIAEKKVHQEREEAQLKLRFVGI